MLTYAAVMGAHFQEGLDAYTAERVAHGLARAVTVLDGVF
jgi:hypothetical protein